MQSLLVALARRSYLDPNVCGPSMLRRMWLCGRRRRRPIKAFFFCGWVFSCVLMSNRGFSSSSCFCVGRPLHVFRCQHEVTDNVTGQRKFSMEKYSNTMRANQFRHKSMENVTNGCNSSVTLFAGGNCLRFFCVSLWNFSWPCFPDFTFSDRLY